MAAGADCDAADVAGGAAVGGTGAGRREGHLPRRGVAADRTRN